MRHLLDTFNHSEFSKCNSLCTCQQRFCRHLATYYFCIKSLYFEARWRQLSRALEGIREEYFLNRKSHNLLWYTAANCQDLSELITNTFLFLQLFESYLVCFSIRQLSKSLSQFDALLYENEGRTNASGPPCASIRIDDHEIFHSRTSIFTGY